MGQRHGTLYAGESFSSLVIEAFLRFIRIRHFFSPRLSFSHWQRHRATSTSEHQQTLSEFHLNFRKQLAHFSNFIRDKQGFKLRWVEINTACEGLRLGLPLKKQWRWKRWDFTGMMKWEFKACSAELGPRSYQYRDKLLHHVWIVSTHESVKQYFSLILYDLNTAVF